MSYSSDEEAVDCCLKGLICSTRNSFFPDRNIPKDMFRPPSPTYSIDTDSEGNHYMVHYEKYLETIYNTWKDMIECTFATTKRENKICCMLFRPYEDAKYTILYSHGNCSDIGADLAFCLRLGFLIDCKVFSYDYSGYGASTGTPSHRSVLEDIEAAWDLLKSQFGVPEERIVLYGRGLGTVPTIELASKKKPAAVILLSPLTSAKSVDLYDGSRIQQQFHTIDKISKVSSPIIVIHGVNDRVISLSHSVSIYNRYGTRIDPLWVQGAGHEDIQFNMVYMKRMRRFAKENLGVRQSKENLNAKIEHLKRMNLYI